MEAIKLVMLIQKCIPLYGQIVWLDAVINECGTFCETKVKNAPLKEN